MQIDQRYRLSSFPLNLSVTKALDFGLEPYLLLEKDIIGNMFLSYLVDFDHDNEQRLYVQISNDRYNEIAARELDIRSAYEHAENSYVYFCDLSLHTGAVSDAYMVPSVVFNEINPVQEGYFITTEIIAAPELDRQEILAYSTRKQKLVLDLYIQSQNLINNIKPYAFYKVVTPVVEIIKSFLDFDNRNADQFLAFSNIRQKSLGITIEINYSHDFFLEKETREIKKVLDLLNSQSKEDLEAIIATTNNDKYLKEYTKIIKAVIDNDAYLHSAYANPITKEVLTTSMDKRKATILKDIIEETFETIEDVEEIVGSFLEIDIDKREPTFKVRGNDDEDDTIRGKIETSLLDKLKGDLVNIGGKETYKFTIKTIYHPETTVKAEEIKRFLINYERVT